MHPFYNPKNTVMGVSEKSDDIYVSRSIWPISAIPFGSNELEVGMWSCSIGIIP